MNADLGESTGPAGSAGWQAAVGGGARLRELAGNEWAAAMRSSCGRCRRCSGGGGVSVVKWVYRSAVRTVSGVALCVLVGGFGVGVGSLILFCNSLICFALNSMQSLGGSFMTFGGSFWHFGG